MATQREGLVWEALRLAADGAPKDEFLAKAMEAKRDIIAVAYRLWKEVLLLDDTVGIVAPDDPWTAGWTLDLLPGKTTVEPIAPAKTSADKARRILELADSMLDGGGGFVKSGDIAAILKGEGYEGPVRDLAVSAGNILSRSENWQKVTPGEYSPVEE